MQFEARFSHIASPFSKGGQRGIFGDCHSLSIKNPLNPPLQRGASRASPDEPFRARLVMPRLNKTIALARLPGRKWLERRAGASSMQWCHLNTPSSQRKRGPSPVNITFEVFCKFRLCGGLGPLPRVALHGHPAQRARYPASRIPRFALRWDDGVCKGTLERTGRHHR